MLPVIVFDDGLGRLGPLTDVRASFQVRTGALTALERVRRHPELKPVALAAPGRLAALIAETEGLPVNDPDSVGADDCKAGLLLVNGRCAVLPEVESLDPDSALVERSSSQIVAARLSRADCVTFCSSGRLPDRVRSTQLDGPSLLHRPWDLIRLRDRALLADLTLLAEDLTQDVLPPGVGQIGEHGLTIHPDALVYPTALFDLEKGPVVVAEHATIRPGAIVAGPAFIGPHSSVIDRAHIKANTAIGPHCKVGGEVGGTIFQGYSNKSHDGHLGDSYVGEWVNLGAGTTNSNLLNTYGEVIARADHAAPNEQTGLTFLGCVLGDHVKTAIGTRIMTGASVGTGTMWAAGAAISGAVPPFQWVTDADRRAYNFDKFLQTAAAMMARRQLRPSEAYVAALRSVHAPAPAPR